MPCPILLGPAPKISTCTSRSSPVKVCHAPPVTFCVAAFHALTGVGGLQGTLRSVVGSHSQLPS